LDQIKPQNKPRGAEVGRQVKRGEQAIRGVLGGEAGHTQTATQFCNQEKQGSPKKWVKKKDKWGGKHP